MLLVKLLLFLLFQIETIYASGEVIPNDATRIPNKSLYSEILFELDKNKNDTVTIAEAEKYMI